MLDAYWEPVAALAWCSYLQEGPGALVLAPTLAPVCPDLAGSLGSIAAAFVPVHRLATLADVLPANVVHVLHAMVGQYRPEQEVVVVFAGPDGSVQAYRLGTGVPIGPPVADAHQTEQFLRRSDSDLEPSMAMRQPDEATMSSMADWCSVGHVLERLLRGICR